MNDVCIIGVGMTRFGKHLDKSLKELGKEAALNAIEDVNIDHSQIEAAFVGNAMAGILSGQECIRGQVILNDVGLSDVNVINTENACASGSSAFHLAWTAVASGVYDVVLVLAAEKMVYQDKNKAFKALESGTDVEQLKNFPGYCENSKGKSIFMDYYADEANKHMNQYGTSIETLAKIAEKNSYNGSFNPYAQYQEAHSLESILQSRMISDPLRLLMCSPVSDGAAAAVLCNKKVASKFSTKPIYVASSVGVSEVGSTNDKSTVERAAIKSYEKAGLGPDDLDVLEVHDATVIGELLAYEQLGLCQKGQGGELIESGKTKLDGDLPVNPSGGLISRGHPVGATGVAQIVEIVWQLRGAAGKRQVSTDPKVGLTENVGGFINNDNAAAFIHLLKK
ncbi:acetyl-CoA acetyltransferase [Caldalkalibacillus uzonensis]|uniref:propanoyl-CoA C-acyltransferase n=1 Tax=Caldalkalibacillus uzonensis TaxID=353224 RepID=A0ABU0CVU4_9BACI|nr:thiolase family protein [Caldalkalibacillus uzonensis]MDQ0340538.1 acetyl-CoA acetyltransferase [Caldalkalibacillus uzonensis]